MKDKYEVKLFFGIVVKQNNSGEYEVLNKQKIGNWRIGKHTSGNFKKIGQIFLTENNLRVMIVSYDSLEFKKRHRYKPMKRFLDDYVNDDLLNQIKSNIH